MAVVRLGSVRGLKRSRSSCDGCIRQYHKSQTAFVDSKPPEVSLAEMPRCTSSSSLLLQGTVVDSRSGIASLTINGNEVTIGQDGSSEWRVRLAVAADSLTVRAVDGRCNETSWDAVADRVSAVGAGFIAVGGPLTVGGTVGVLAGISFSMDAAPIIKNGRMLLPVRSLVERLGGQVRWNARTRTTTITLGAHSVVLAIGRNAAVVACKSVHIHEADEKVVPEAIRDHTYLPLRFVADSLGLDLVWDPIVQVISSTYWPE